MVRHPVAFYETDAMGIVHHSNHVRFFELGRVAWLTEHDQAYEAYVAQGVHFATTHVEVDYHRPARFGDVVEITVWPEAVRGASLRMGYALRVGREVVATGTTEHASVDASGRVVRLPRERRDALRKLAPR